MAKQRQVTKQPDAELRVIRHPDYVYPPPLNVSELDQLESELGSPLPQGYRQFLTRFGSGGIIEVHLLSPVNAVGAGKPMTVLHQTKAFRKLYRSKPRSYRNHEWLSQLVYFARDFTCNDDFVWDPRTVTQHAPHENRFFYLQHAREDEPIAVGDSFAQFLRWLTTEYRSRGAGDDVVPTNPPNEFHPAILRRKQAPQQQLVRRWLAHSNVRDLALAIRDHGRVEAFPVLADALEEAGCTNADVLDSCRRGDPDIDGVWVLRVLLGEK